MEFLNKNDAFLFLKDKHDKNIPLTEEELQAVKIFFTEEELMDLSFDKISVSDCVRHNHNLEG